MNRSQRSYHELIKYTTFDERFNYLRIGQSVGLETFGSHRKLNQIFYASKEWKDVRQSVIIRDNCCDLGIEDRPIFSRATVHHIVPLTIDDIINRNPKCLDPDNLITVSYETHQALTYGGESKKIFSCIERKPNDTAPWLMQ